MRNKDVDFGQGWSEDGHVENKHRLEIEMNDTYTTYFLECVEEGYLDADEALMMCVKFMGEQAVKMMVKANELPDPFEEN